MSFGLVVLIWLVQLVIYPAFADIAPERFVRWQARYTRTISWVVVPLMLAHVGLIAWRLVVAPGVSVGLAAAMVTVAWVATFALAVPAHDRLQAGGPENGVIGQLVATNRIRTVAWTLAFLFTLP
jgi:hypothetical protein